MNVDVNEDWAMIRERDEINGRNTTTLECRKNICTCENVINAFASSSKGGAFVFAMEVLDGIDENMFIEEHV